MEAGRLDVLKAVQHHGGPESVAKRLGLQSPRRAHRHWDDIMVRDVQREHEKLG